MTGRDKSKTEFNSIQKYIFLKNLFTVVNKQNKIHYFNLLLLILLL